MPATSDPDGADRPRPLRSTNRLISFAYKRARRVVVLVIGVTVVLVGLALLLLPGPGVLVILVGLGLLATEFVWAKALLRRARRQAQSMGRAANRLLRPSERREAVKRSKRTDTAKDSDAQSE